MAETTRITSLNMLLDATGKMLLAEEYGKVIENVQKNAISGKMKNTELSGDPSAGTVEAKRLANAESNTYGTARKTAKGTGVKGKTVTVAIDTDKEIVEEVEQKDVSLLGVDGLIAKRSANHSLRMVSELDSAFFSTAATDATEVDLTGVTAIEEQAETMIQQCETTKNAYVDGVPRSMMHMVCSPKVYGKLRTYLDKVTVPGVGSADEEFYAYHGVKTYSCVHLPKDVDFLVMVDGAVAQPVMSDEYTAEKIPLSNAFGISLFYHYGTKSVMPDLIFKNKKTEV